MQILQQRLADVAAAGRVPKQAHAADAGGARRQPAGGRAPRPGRASAAAGGVLGADAGARARIKPRHGGKNQAAGEEGGG